MEATLYFTDFTRYKYGGVMLVQMSLWVIQLNVRNLLKNSAKKQLEGGGAMLINYDAAGRKYCFSTYSAKKGLIFKVAPLAYYQK